VKTGIVESMCFLFGECGVCSWRPLCPFPYLKLASYPIQFCFSYLTNISTINYSNLLIITTSVPKYKKLLIIAYTPIHNFDYEYI
jgi:hypothetical protein